ncbi:MAG: TonB-dependent receptor plug domain-containing protein [Chitinophagaceae bacterium]|nr:TonB-dependent receptor plug domain-containing protein [Chitinophagaceae bacterium]
MKALIPLLWVYCLMASVALHAQQDPTITITVKNMPLGKVFTEAKKKTGYTFFYEEALIEKTPPVTIDAKDMSLRTFLQTILAGQPLTFSMVNTTVIIAQKTESQHSVALQITVTEPEDILIQGRVEDINGAPLAGVTITVTPKLPRRRIWAVSQSNGAFEILGQKGDRLVCTAVGHKKCEARYNGEHLLRVTMEEEAVVMGNVEVSNMDYTRKKIPFTDTIDMTHKGHLNLGQLLQGTVPGLTLQNSSLSQQVLSSLFLGDGLLGGMSTVTLAQLQANYNQQSRAQYPTFNDYLNFRLSQGPARANYNTVVTNIGLVPQLRGASGFNGNTSAMLIVIDGFPQDGFPADYPMSNIESVRVIKDPEELTKWGPSAAGGVILIASKRGTQGKLRLTYGASYYYSRAPRFNRDQRQLASSADVLSYLADATDSGFLSYSAIQTPFNLTPAERLLQSYKTGVLSKDNFTTQWDSLKRLSNEDQIGLLQQNVFNQNHLLSLSGGSKVWRFLVSGAYTTNRTTALRSYNHTEGLVANNDFLLLRNKLRANLYVNISGTQGNTGYTFDPYTLQPYQMLLDARGNYIYDYPNLDPHANAVIQGYGYYNYGVSLLEDARVNSIVTKSLTVNSRLNMDWDLFPGLKWTSSLQYQQLNKNIRTIQGASSSQARQLMDNYGSPVFDGTGKVTGIDFYVPLGGTLQVSPYRSPGWNLRSALLYKKSFGKHALSVELGGGGFSNTVWQSAYATIYGYDPQTGAGQPVRLPSPDNTAGIPIYYSLPSSVFSRSARSQRSYPYTLLAPKKGDTTIQRGFNWNGGIKYAFDNTVVLNARYNTVLSPNFGYTPPYTTLSGYSADLLWRLSKYAFLNVPAWISDISASAGVDGIDIPHLPAQITSNRMLQSEWNNYGVWVDSYNTAQQSGQRAYNVYQKLSIGLFDNRYTIGVSYNTLHSDSTVTKTGGNHAPIHYVGIGSRLRLRKGAFIANADFGRSLDGQVQSNIRAIYDISRETYFHSTAISRLTTDFTIQEISPLQGMELMTGTNVPLAGGGFSMAVNNNFGLLPPGVKNTEAHAVIGFLKDRYLVDVRYYRKVSSGLNNSIPLPTDPSTGLGTQVTYSSIINRGIELFLTIKAVQGRQFSYTVTLNGAYNENIAQLVPTTYFSQTSTYMTALRNGYSTANIWSYRWAGLDTHGNPQIYDTKGQKTARPDSLTLATTPVYSGVTRAPYTGGLIQDWTLGNFFAHATIVFSLGHVMREYIPSSSGSLDNSQLIRYRWRSPGDETHTDIAAMSSARGSGSTRTFIIQNATNSIMPADNIRLQDVQIGWKSPQDMFPKSSFIKDLTLSLQGVNLAVWTRNKLHVDPGIVSSDGHIGSPIPRQYSFTINANF